MTDGTRRRRPITVVATKRPLGQTDDSAKPLPALPKRAPTCYLQKLACLRHYGTQPPAMLPGASCPCRLNAGKPSTRLGEANAQSYFVA